MPLAPPPDRMLKAQGQQGQDKPWVSAEYLSPRYSGPVVAQEGPSGLLVAESQVGRARPQGLLRAHPNISEC